MNPTIEDQIALEDYMQGLGRDKALHRLADMAAADRGAETGYGASLINGFVDQIAEALDMKVNQSKGAAANGTAVRLLRGMDMRQAAYLGLRAIINKCSNEQPMKRVMQKVLISIGTMIEDEQFCRQFRLAHDAYFETILSDFKRKGTVSYQHKHRVLRHVAKDKGFNWVTWTNKERVTVGLLILHYVLELTDMVERTNVWVGFNKKLSVLQFTDTAMKFITDWTSRAADMCPEHLPMIVPPAPWRSLTDGGYITPSLRARTRFVKTQTAVHRRALEAANLGTIFDAVNAIQDTSWRINVWVFEVLAECFEKQVPIGIPEIKPTVIPPSPVPRDLGRDNMSDAQLAEFLEWKRAARAAHEYEQHRRSRLIQTATCLRIARDFKDYEHLWFVHSCDFRGRVYAACTLSPQGSDPGRGMLEFAEGKPLGQRGLYWLLVHAANKYGFDKGTFDERFDWASEKLPEMERIAVDPIGERQLWQDADKPWQYLAVVLEIVQAMQLEDPTTFVSHIPVGIDGACNGLQHFSAMLRDERGGAAVNLVPGERPRDIYSDVAAAMATILDGLVDGTETRFDFMFPKKYLEDDATYRRLLDLWRVTLITRKATKTPVMTLPYGATRRTCTDSLFDWLRSVNPEGDKKTALQMAIFGTAVLWEAITRTLVGSRQAMDWIQAVARVLAKRKRNLEWTTPLGFPVVQRALKTAHDSIDSALCGRVRLKVPKITAELDSRKQASGASPNLVHSMDATHMMMTVLTALDWKVTSFAMIHDDFGTHACDIPILAKALREAFVTLYTEHDILQSIYEEHEEYNLPQLPLHGNLDVTRVAESAYFFS